MASSWSLSRRSFLAATAAAPFAFAQSGGKRVPVGLELYSVRDELTKDLMGTVRGVAKMGYQVVEFYSPYYSWTTDQAKEVRKLMDDLNIKCMSTHNGANAFLPEGLDKGIELNQIIGSKDMIMASAGRIRTIEGWSGIADRLTKASEKLKTVGMRAGFHNHKVEFVELEGKRPMDVLAANTPKDVVLQFDVGTCVEAAQDPVAWIKANPGRIKSIHCKDWGAGEGKGFKVLFGEGDSPWKDIFQAAESVGGVELYLIEQEGSRFPSMETAQKCLDTWKKMRG